MKAIAKLKPEKSSGSDNIIGEIFTASPIFIAPLLKKLFQIFFRISLSYILHSWTSAKHLISSIEESVYE
jgi:hypothetical protein